MDKKLKVFIDLDGVLANFVKAACKHFSTSGLESKVISGIYKYSKVKYPKEAEKLSIKWLQEKWNILKSDIDNLRDNYAYWLSIEPYMWTNFIIYSIKKHTDNFYILSKPMDHSTCYAAKVDWCLKYLPITREQIIITEVPKYIFASSEFDVLIDDKPSQINNWNNNSGGTGYLWEELTDHIDNYLEVLNRLQELESILLNLKSKV